MTEELKILRVEGKRKMERDKAAGSQSMYSFKYSFSRYLISALLYYFIAMLPHNYTF